MFGTKLGILRVHSKLLVLLLLYRLNCFFTSSLKARCMTFTSMPQSQVHSDYSTDVSVNGLKQFFKKMCCETLQRHSSLFHKKC